MYFNYDFMNRINPPNMYIANPNNKIITSLRGVKSAKAKIHLRDIWAIEFEVDKYILKNDKKTENPSYKYILHSREVFIENIGWFRINSYPAEEWTDNHWVKHFTAYGYETTLEDIDIVGININCGTEDSVEMFDENLNELGIPKNNIQLYIKNANNDPNSDEYWKLGLLNIIEHEYLYLKGWKIGTIDEASAVLRGRQFEIDNQNIYAFLTQDVASTYKCMFIFDRMNKTINAIRIENLGKDINIELTLRNLINSISIKDQNEDFYTRFRVSGNDNDTALIEYINYGNDMLTNISYGISVGNLSEETVAKYKIYQEFIDSHREEYADFSRSYLKLQEEKDVYYEQVPVSEVDILFTNVTDDELSVELEHYKTVLTMLEDIHTDESGILHIEGTIDYALYVSVRDVMIPKIQAEIDARKDGKHAEPFDYETNWELYGINNLTIFLDKYNTQVDVLKKYDKPWEESETSMTKDAYERQHELCEKYRTYITEIQSRLDKLNKKVQIIDQQISNNTSSQKLLAEKAQLTYSEWGFTEDELSDIYSLYRDTDYTDSTIEILETDTIDDIINLAWQLYDSAKEQIEIESHPQLSYETSIDNIFHIDKFSKKANDISIGDFCYLELDSGYKTKQRIIGMEFELVDFNDTDIQIEFSDMITVCGKADDYRFLLETGGSSSKNSITRKQQTYISKEISTTALKLFAKYYQGDTVFEGEINSSDLEKMQSALNGLIQGYVNSDNLRSELSKLESLENNSPFLRYLQSQLANSDITVSNLTSLTATQISTLFSDNLFSKKILSLIDDAILEYGKTISNNILDISHPIGSLLFTDNADNPSTYLGGTWEEWEPDCIPISASSTDEANIITEDELQSYVQNDTETSTSIVYKKQTQYVWKRTA